MTIIEIVVGDHRDTWRCGARWGNDEDELAASLSPEQIQDDFIVIAVPDSDGCDMDSIRRRIQYLNTDLGFYVAAWRDARTLMRENSEPKTLKPWYDLYPK